MGSATSIFHSQESRHISPDSSISSPRQNAVIDKSTHFYTDIGSSSVVVPKSQRVRSILLAALKNKFMFSPLSKEQLNTFIDMFVPNFCKIGEIVIKQGETGDYMYVIEDGLFEVTKIGEGKLGQYGSGDTFGELSLLYNAEISITVTCIHNATVWKLDRRTFKACRTTDAQKYSKFILDLLAGVHLFKEMNYFELVRMFEVAKPTHFNKGDIIVPKNELNNALYVIAEGIVTCSHNYDDQFLHSQVLSNTKKRVSLTSSIKSHIKNNHKNHQSIRFKAGDWFGYLLENEIEMKNASSSSSSSKPSPEINAETNGTILIFEKLPFKNAFGDFKDLVDRNFHKKMLVQLPILSQFSNDQREHAVKMFTIEHYVKGDTIAYCGDINPKLYVIKSGDACVWYHPELSTTLKHRTSSEPLDIGKSTLSFSSSRNSASGSSNHKDLKHLLSIEERLSEQQEVSSSLDEPDGDPPPFLHSKVDVIDEGGSECHLKKDHNNDVNNADVNAEHGYNREAEPKVEPEGPPPLVAKQCRIESIVSDNHITLQLQDSGDFKTDQDGEPDGAPPLVFRRVIQRTSETNTNSSASMRSSIQEDSFRGGGGEDLIRDHATQGLLSTPKEKLGTFRTTRCTDVYDALSSFEVIPSLSLSSSACDSSAHGNMEAQWRARLKKEAMINSEGNCIRSEQDWTKPKNMVYDNNDGEQNDGADGKKTEKDITSIKQGHEEMLATGDYVGDEPIFNGTPMDCTVIAKSNVTCFVLSQTDLISLIDDNEDEQEDLSGKRSYNTAGRRFRIISKSFDSYCYVDKPVPAKKEVLWENLQNLGELGNGSFGKVYLVQDIKDKTHYALKVIETNNKNKSSTRENRIKTEIDILKQMKSPYICKLHANGIGGHRHFMLLEYVPGGDFKKLIHPLGNMTKREKRAKVEKDLFEGKLAGMPHQAAKFYIATISLPLVYLHRRGIAYRDLKPENIMIDRFGYPKLIDFGLSKRIDHIGKTFTLCGSTEYMAPEIILGDGHNQAVDWWALGIVLYEMVVGATPFAKRGVPRNQQEQIDIFERTILGNVRYPVDMQNGCMTLISKLLNPKPVFRLGCCRRGNKEFEEHEWFQEISWVALNARQMRPPWVPQHVDLKIPSIDQSTISKK